MRRRNNMKKLMIIAVAGIVLVLSAFGAENRLSAGPEIPPADFVQEVQNADDCDFTSPDWVAVAALTLGMDPDELRVALLEEDQILAEITKARGVDLQMIIDTIIAAETDWIDEMAAGGELTYEEAEEWKAGLKDDVRCFVEEGSMVFEDVGPQNIFIMRCQVLPSPKT
jgi:hypothetical protein